MVQSFYRKQLLFLASWLLLCPLLCLSHGNPDVQSKNYRFIENKGQWGLGIKFKAELGAGEFLLGKNKLAFTFLDNDQFQDFLFRSHPATSGKEYSNNPVQINTHTVQFQFVGANRSPKVTGEEPFSEYRNYFLGNDTARWARHVNTFQKVRYQELYNGIDLTISQLDEYYKYEYTLEPEIDPNQIQVNILGAEELRIEAGHLIIKTSVNEIIDAPPIAWQEINGKRKYLRCQYILEGTTLSFDVKGRIRKDLPLIIDPKLIFSTSSGSTADHWGNTACLDNEGNLFAGGTIFRTTGGNPNVFDPSGFPATLGAYQNSHQGGFTDMTIMKFDSAGTQLLYATYIGGNSTDVPTSTVVDDDGNLFILGVTGSSDFPAAIDTFSGGLSLNTGVGFNYPDGSDIVVIKMRTDGSNILMSKYYGGSNNDGLTGFTVPTTANYSDQFRGEIVLDGAGDVFVASVTSSSDFSTVGSLGALYHGGATDGIVLKLNPNTLLPYWSGYVGGARNDVAYAVQVDGAGNAFVTGGTNSPAWELRGHDSLYNGNLDGYVIKIPATGDSISAGTFVGTNRFDQAYFVQIDESNNLDDVVLFGQTRGVFPSTPGTYNDDLAGQFIVSYTNDLESVNYSFTFGSSALDSTMVVPNISPAAFLVNECGNIFVSGWGGIINQDYLPFKDYGNGNTIGMPITPDLATKTTTDGNDFYLGAFRKNGTELLFGTYFGGDVSYDHVDGGTSRFDKAGVVYQSVCSGCSICPGCGPNTDFPVFPETPSPNGYPTTNQSGNCNNGVFKYDLAFLEAQFSFDQETCLDKTIDFTNESVGGIDFNWNFGDGTFFDTTTASDVSHTYLQGGEYEVILTVTDFATCTGLDTARATIRIIDSVLVEKDTILCPGESVVVTATSTFPTPIWDVKPGTMACTECAVNLVTPPQAQWYVARSIGSATCEHADSVFIDLHPDPNDFNRISVVVPRCHDDPVFFTGAVESEDCICCEPATQWRWFLGDGTIVEDETYAHTYPEGGIYEVVLETITTDTLYDTLAVEVYVSDSCLKNIYIPNAFTPNDDGENDELFVRGINIIDLDFHLYDRLGEEVFYTNSLRRGWDGVFRNKPMAPQVFVYTCEATFWDGSTIQKEGNVTLLE